MQGSFKMHNCASSHDRWLELSLQHAPKICHAWCCVGTQVACSMRCLMQTNYCRGSQSGKVPESQQRQ